MIPSHLCFKKLKKSVSIETVLIDKGLIDRFEKRPGGRLIGPCPIHRGDNPKAFVADLGRNIWHCFTGCNAGGDVIDFTRKLCGITYHQTATYLATLAHAPTPQPLASHASGINAKFRPFIKRLHLDPTTPWLQKKGIHAATARRFECGRYHNQGFLADCIGVRLHDIEGRPLGYMGRRLNPKQSARFGKYKFPPGFPKKQILYNYHRVRSLPYKGLVVVECPWGVMRLAQLNIPAIALLGINLPPSLHRLLQDCLQVVLMLDGDAAGQRASHQISGDLKSLTRVHPIYLPQGLDPDDLSNESLSGLLRPYF